MQNLSQCLTVTRSSTLPSATKTTWLCTFTVTPLFFFSFAKSAVANGSEGELPPGFLYKVGTCFHSLLWKWPTGRHLETTVLPSRWKRYTITLPLTVTSWSWRLETWCWLWPLTTQTNRLDGAEFWFSHWNGIWLSVSSTAHTVWSDI